MKLLLAALLALAPTAFAAPHPPTIDTMTCSEAIAYGVAHGRVWVWASGNDIVPIYPVITDPYSVKCPTGDIIKPYFFPTKDTEACVISWKCGK